MKVAQINSAGVEVYAFAQRGKDKLTSDSLIIKQYEGGKRMITSKELTALEDQLNYEQILIKKYNTFAKQCNDAEIRNKCTQIANKHQQHFNTLLQHLS